jgi:hypothetical protein
MVVDRNNMATPNKIKIIEIQDCRDCQHFFWDFNLGQFKCAIQDNEKIEEIHIIPDWCPLPYKRTK